MTAPFITQRSFALMLALAGLSLASGCDDAPVVSQDTPVGEHAYAELAQQWVLWASALPFSTGPVMDPTGDQCALGQSGKVWFLAGTWGGEVERSCSIPQHKYLFIPLINRWVIDPTEPIENEEAMDELVEFAEGYFADNRAHTCSLTLRLDGEDLLGDTAELDAELYVQVLEPFEIQVNDDNWATQYGLLGGPYPSVADGHYALLRPLDPGEHTLEIGGMTCDGEDVWFETSAVYHLDVAQ
jgi:hypothetical protein